MSLNVPKEVINLHEQEIIKQVLLDEYEDCQRQYDVISMT